MFTMPVQGADKITSRKMKKNQIGKIKIKSKIKTSESVERRKDTKLTTQPKPGQRLLNFLMSHHVDKKEIHGVNVTNHVLAQLTEQEVRDLKSVFEIFDLNSDGFLSPVDLWRALKSLGFKISKDEAMTAIRHVNFEGRKKINFSEFLEIVIDKQGDARDTYSEIMKGFEKFDFDGAGGISLEKLRQVCRQAGVQLSQQELEGMIDEADVNGDGSVDKSEFMKIMLKTNLF